MCIAYVIFILTLVTIPVNAKNLLNTFTYFVNGKDSIKKYYLEIRFIGSFSHSLSVFTLLAATLHLPLSLSLSHSFVSSCKFVLWYFRSCFPVAHTMQPKSKQIRIAKQGAGNPCRSRLHVQQQTSASNDFPLPSCVVSHLTPGWVSCVEVSLAEAALRDAQLNLLATPSHEIGPGKAETPATPKMQAQMPQVGAHLPLSLLGLPSVK